MQTLGLTIALAMVCSWSAPLWAADAKDGAEFFETRIRPVLVDKCYNCHSASAKKVKGKLKLDTKADLMRGGDTGAAIVAGDPDKSLLIKALRYTDEDLQMPPKEKLPAGTVKAFEEWVKMGAPYPDSGPAQAAAPKDDPREFWSFQKPKPQAIPQVKNSSWVQTPIDAFILASLEKSGLMPARPADRRTLIRRASFDLLGVPPTQAQVDAFITDSSPKAFEKVVDQLLASPHYGERWGRFWLDVARYADTKGYVFQEERRYPYSYTYRDWVVRALNQDMPYDRFLMLQVAADRLVAEHQAGTEDLAAMGFLTLGRRFLNNQADIIDDRMDVLFRGTQAMTIGCARCHDHKFDPIPQKDYYSIYGVFASSTEPAELPLISSKKTPQTEAFEKELAAREGEIAAFRLKRHTELLASLRSDKELGVYLEAAYEMRVAAETQIKSFAQKKALRQAVIHRWIEFLKRTEQAKEPVFAVWRALAALPEKEFEAKAPAAIASVAGMANPVVMAAFKETAPKSMKEAAQRYAKLLSSHDKPEKAGDVADEQVRAILHSAQSPLAITLADVETLFLRDDREKMQGLKQKIDALRATHPGAPARAMVLNDLPNPVQPHIFKRGNPAMPGAAVPREFLEVLSPVDRKPFSKGSGRLELAQCIASKDNPLTARVIVNRIWLNHFGFGLVRTPSDFGTRGDRPTHPELLDYLAVRFMNDGWSIKKLHRLIMLSSVYQQSSDYDPANYHADPENRLLSHMNRRRLDFEGTRDSLLFVSGRIDLTMGGRAVDILSPDARRRTIYGFIDRQNLPNLFRSFDFASPDATSPQRFTTTVPQQALFMMNSPFIMEQAKSLVRRSEIDAQKEPVARITELYRLLFQRPPAADEIGMGQAFIHSEESHAALVPEQLNPWEKYAQVLLLSNEFVFVD